MHVDVKEIRDFYAHPVGQLARGVILDEISRLWPETKGLNIAGLGYAIPYLQSFQNKTPFLVSLMPAEQGALIWPANGAVRSTLVKEDRLPLPDGSIDRLLVIHALEMSNQAYDLLSEAERVLRPDGEIIIVIPNRRGLWAGLDNTPFGHGRPYSLSQCKQLCKDSHFQIHEYAYRLFTPPYENRLTFRWTSSWEKLGRKAWPIFGGVLIIKASKNMLRPKLKKENARMRGLFNLVPAQPIPASRIFLSQF